MFILFFFARPTDSPLREGGRWETKHFMGMALPQLRISVNIYQKRASRYQHSTAQFTQQITRAEQITAQNK